MSVARDGEEEAAGLDMLGGGEDTEGLADDMLLRDSEHVVARKPVKGGRACGCWRCAQLVYDLSC